MSRLRIHKTLKMFANGAFIRSESGQTLPATAKDGSVLNVPRTSRKDLRNTLEAARKAQPGWAARSAYNRGQILYRLAEMIDARLDDLPTTKADAAAAADRAVHYAGWADKISAILSTLNPVASTFVNYSQVRPLGIVVATPHADDGLLGMVEAACASAVMGNATTLIVPAALGELAIAFGECLATSDLPAGVINVLTGIPAEVLATANIHDDLDALWMPKGSVDDAAILAAERDGAQVLRRIIHTARAATPASPIDLQRLAEVQTVWMSAFEPQGGAAAY